MRITYVGRSYLDYRIPVFRALAERTNGAFSLIYNADYVPVAVQAKTRSVLGAHAIGMTGEIRLGGDPIAVDRVANKTVRFVYQPGVLRRIAETRPDVLVADGFFQWTAFALAYRLRHGTPLVVCYERTAHMERHAQWYRRLYRKMVLPLVDAMSCNGHLCCEYTMSLGMPRERITLGHMVADTEGLAVTAASLTVSQRLSIRADWGQPDTVFIVVGRLVVAKGVRELLDAWMRFNATHSGNFCLVFVGDGPEEAAMRSHVAECGLKNVVFHGRARYDDVGLLYAAADALIMPTLQDNWSLVVPEAMACGLPVVCSRYNGCYPELIHDGVNGWVFDPLAAADVARVLGLLVENRARLPAMGEASKQIVASHTPEHAAQAIFDACRIAIAHRHGSAHAHPAGA